MTDGNDWLPPRGDHLRVWVWFGEHLLVNYSAELIAALRYTAAMARHFSGLTVTVDNEVTDGMRPLPCEQLWTLAP